MNNRKSIGWLLLSVAIAQGLGFLSSQLAGDVGAKYAMLQKPPLSPPGGVFGIAWIILYLAMAVAAWLVFRADTPSGVRRAPLLLYCAQLIVNFAWSPVFFGGAMWIAVAVIAVLDILALLTTAGFFRISRAAGWLMIPYLLWLLYATYLNIGFAIVN